LPRHQNAAIGANAYSQGKKPDVQFLRTLCKPISSAITASGIPTLSPAAAIAASRYLLRMSAKDLFLVILEQVRKRYQGSIFGYVVMPEHIHPLLSEPKRKDLSTFMRVLTQRVADGVYPRSRRPGLSRQAELGPSVTPGPKHFWQPRFHDFNVFTRYKFIQKWRYIHRNPNSLGFREHLMNNSD
jgi:REP element-mobilizing transposase RayT